VFLEKENDVSLMTSVFKFSIYILNFKNMLRNSTRFLAVQEGFSAASLGRLNHVAIAVPKSVKLEDAAKPYASILGSKLSPATPLPEHGVVTLFVELPNTKLELLHPLGDNSPIANFFTKNPGGGIHHLCFEVDDLDVALAKVKEAGVRVLGPKKIGAHGLPVVFLHPKDCGGVLTELEETKSANKH
jgi:methylmalonyl-CoA/ethylmalonyl-CoA epimerase